MIVALIVSIIFGLAAISNLIHGDYPNAIVGLIIAALLAGIYFFNRSQCNKINDFMEWLTEHKDELKSDRNKHINYNGSAIKLGSYVTQFQFATSFLFVTFKQSTCFVHENQSNKTSIQIISTIFTLILGWWGIPWGPIYTFQSLYINMTGGRKKLISELIHELESVESVVDVKPSRA